VFYFWRTVRTSVPQGGAGQPFGDLAPSKGAM